MSFESGSRFYTEEQKQELPSSVFEPSYNCWRVGLVEKAHVLIDCANFYRALHKAFAVAEKSIFIVGWDAESTTRLLRGDEEKKSALPSSVIELLSWRARTNPNLKIYILPWDCSVAFLGEREMMPEYAWTHDTPENIHFCLDDTIPLWGSHHQKVIVVDDEIAFTGGMDLARQRWDERDHKINEPERVDENGPYGPYHDVQILLQGPITEHLSELVRWRWENAAGYAAVPYVKPRTKNPLWPVDKIDFAKMEAAIARTHPHTAAHDGVQEVHQMYLDLISKAEHFIYIENQYLSTLDIAHALNKQLRLKKTLKVLIVSSFNPQGIFESEALWAGRIDFKKILEKDIEPDRVRIVCSGIENADKPLYKRIHSKIFIVDDKYLSVGSANISNRSMALDTECDLILAGDTDQSRRHISRVRNDLLGEHCGRSPEEISDMFRKPVTLNEFMKPKGADFYRLYPISDEQFTSNNFKSIVSMVADPSLPEKSGPLWLKNPTKLVVIAGIIFVALLAGLAYFIREHVSWFTPESIEAFLLQARSSIWAFPIVLGIYILGGFILFPVTVLSLITAAVFGNLWGPIYGMTGALTSAAIMFWLGHWAGLKGTRQLVGERIRRIDHQFRKAGILGVTVLRVIPIAPFSIVNIAAGFSSVKFWDFIIGSFLGFLPAFIVKGIVGDSLVQVLLNPTTKTFYYLGGGMALWMVLVLGSYFVTKAYREKHES